jgi:hypothetical protein
LQELVLARILKLSPLTQYRLEGLKKSLDMDSLQQKNIHTSAGDMDPNTIELPTSKLFFWEVLICIKVENMLGCQVRIMFLKM